MSAPSCALSVEGLRKSFGEQLVFDGISFSVATGTVFALLGPNGSGKTTTVQILSTLLAPDAGSVTVGGFDLRSDPQQVRRSIGVTGQFSAVDGLLNGLENLQLVADLQHLGRAEGRKRAAALLERFDLVDAASKMVMTYSGGMRRRLDLAMTLMGQPRIIFLDEPTTGLDPRSRQAMWDIVRELVADGVTILLTTQYLDEADELADRVAVLDHGHLVAEGTPAQLKARVPGGQIELHFADHSALAGAAEVLGAASPAGDALVLTVPSDATPQALRAMLDRLDHAAMGSQVERITVATPDLDDVFFALTGSAGPQG